MRSSGPARRFFDGSCIAEFLPVILPSSLYIDRFGYLLALVFLKFSNEDQQKEVFSTLAGNKTAIEEFLKIISSFIDSIAGFVNTRYMFPNDFV